MGIKFIQSDPSFFKEIVKHQLKRKTTFDRNV